MAPISEISSHVLQRAIDRGYLGFNSDARGEYVSAGFAGTDQEFVALCEIVSLIELRCTHSEVTDAFFPKIVNLPQLRMLAISDTSITGSTFGVLEKLPHLEELHCNPREDTALAAASIARCKKLKVLDIAAGHFTDAEIQTFFTPTLEKLDCEMQKRISDEAFAHVGSAPRLQELAAGENTLGDGACEYISACKSLRSLNLGATRITDRGVAALSKISTIEGLHIADTSISARGLSSLRKLPLLRELSISGCPIGDDAIEPILALPALRDLSAARARFSEAGLEKLRAARKWDYFSPQRE